MACLRIVLAVFVAVLTATTSAEFSYEKCPLEDNDLANFAECMSIVRPDIDLESSDIDTATFSEEDLTNIAFCHYEKDGLLTNDGEYFEEKTIESVNETQMDKSIKKEIIKGIKHCGEGKDHKTEGREIVICNSLVVEKVCSDD